MPAPSGNACQVSCRDGTKADKGPDVDVARVAAGQWGVLSLDELFACGLSPSPVLTRVRNGRLHPVHRGVYAVGHAKVPLEGRFLAAVKACGRTAVLSHHSAATLWGFMPWEERPPEVTVLGTAPQAHPGLRVHRTTRLDLDDTTRHHGIPLTTPARTLLDLAATLDPRPLRAATPPPAPPPAPPAAPSPCPASTCDSPPRRWPATDEGKAPPGSPRSS